jgi:hypothetical protein
VSAPLRLSERWAFDAVDRRLVQIVVGSLRGAPLVRHDLDAAFGAVMSGVSAFSIHAVRPMIVPSAPRGAVRTSALLALGVKRIVERGGGPRPARIIFALAMARCLPFYFALRMVRGLDTEQVLKLRFFRTELDSYTRNGVALGKGFVRALNAAGRRPFESYRSLVQLTCRAYQALYDLVRDQNAATVLALVEQEPLAVFMVHFPLAIDLHHVFTEVVRTRPRQIRLDALFEELQGARSLDAFLVAGAA